VAENKSEHLGYKYIHLLLTLVLGAIWALFSFFGWIMGITPVTLQSFAFGIVGITIYLIFAFIWQLLWKFFHKVSGVLMPEGTEHLGFKYIHLLISLILGVIWTLFSFFNWIVLINTPALLTYAYGILGITIYLVFAFIWHALWAFFHKVSEAL